MAILLLMGQYATIVHAGGDRHFHGDIGRISHLVFSDDHLVPFQQDARTISANALR